MERRGRKYLKVYDRRKRLFGVKEEGSRDWHIEPCFEELGMLSWGTLIGDGCVWFKQSGKFGLYNIPERRIVIPAIYGSALYFNEAGLALTWKDHKAGVIDRENNVRIPFIYDEIEFRFRHVEIPDEQRPLRTLDNGETVHVGPKYRNDFQGFACFTNEGDAQAYNGQCRPDRFYDWEKDCLRLDYVPDYENEAVEGMTLATLEELIKEEYGILLRLGYIEDLCPDRPEAEMEALDAQEEKVKSLLRDCRRMMNVGWVHNDENARRIGRTNALLMRAVGKAIRLGRKAARSLQWMERVSHRDRFLVSAAVIPQWTDGKSDLRYQSSSKYKAEEADLLPDDRCDVASTHIWNIIAALGGTVHINGSGACFSRFTSEYDPGDWHERELTGDDGQSWDEYFRLPAYEDVYFTRPFNDLYEQFLYSFEDLCNINDFRVDIEAHLSTREKG